MRFYLRSKIHQAYVTEANPRYVGSITLDSELAERVGLHEGERVLVVSNTSAARLETYVILAPPGSGIVAMNGAAAHLIRAGEEIIVMGFELSDKPLRASCILVDRQNRFVRNLDEAPGVAV